MKRIVLAAGMVSVVFAGVALAQQSGLTRVPLQTQELSAPGRVAVQVRAEFEPGAAAGRHTHPGEELGYIMEGELELRVDGQPPRIVKAGETFFVPAGVVHDGLNLGESKAKMLGTYVVEKGKPLATPAP
ncbi:MAG: cupin domain-containing protein [Betaproteobacteria bacterium]|nr:cupin domain-containing protein [Betaproteobacteria bacterium]